MANTSERALRRGDRGQVVQSLQALLNRAAGRRVVVEDGVFGPKVEAAVSDYQRAERLPVTGVADLATVQRLRVTLQAGAQQRAPVADAAARRTSPPGGSGSRPAAAPAAKDAGGSPGSGGASASSSPAPPAGRVLKRGDTGPDVTALQALLNQKLAATIPNSTLYGSATEHAVRDFQKRRGLPVTGQADAATLAALRAAPDATAATPPLPPPPGVPATKYQEKGAAWDKVWTKATDAWQTLRKEAVAKYSAVFEKDPEKGRKGTEAFIRSLERAKADLDAMAPLVPAQPKTDAERAIVSNYKALSDRYKVLAAGFYSETRPAPKQPQMGFVFLVVLGVLAVSTTGMAWAHTSSKYVDELANQTALQRTELQARVEASKEGRTLQESTLPDRDPEEGLDLVTWLLLGTGVALAGGATGYLVWRKVRRTGNGSARLLAA